MFNKKNFNSKGRCFKDGVKTTSIKIVCFYTELVLKTTNISEQFKTHELHIYDDYIYNTIFRPCFNRYGHP